MVGGDLHTRGIDELHEERKCDEAGTAHGRPLGAGRSFSACVFPSAEMVAVLAWSELSADAGEMRTV